MKKNNLIILKRSFLLFMLFSFVFCTIVHSQSTVAVSDENMDCISDDTHQVLELNQEAYFSIKDTGDIINTITANSMYCQGMTWDGSNLWYSEILTGKIYQVDPNFGSIIKTFDAPGNSVEGLAWDGTHLWASENGGGPYEPSYIYKLDPEDGSVISSFVPDAMWNHGITWDGQYLWMVDFSDDKIIKVDPETGVNVHIIDAPGVACIGLAWDGEHLWTDDFETDKLYCLNPNNGEVIYEVSSPHTNPRDLTWDGDYLWVLAAAASTIYQVDVGYSTSIDEFGFSAGNIHSLLVSPNPMDVMATISYTLKQSDNIQLQILNSNGAIITSIFNSVQNPGDYQFEIDGKKLMDGIYYCVLQAGEERLVKKLVVIK